MDSPLGNEFIVEHDTNEEFRELFRDMSSLEMLEELNAITSKWEAQCEESYHGPRISERSFMVKPRKPSLFPPTYEFSFVMANDTNSSFIVHDQETQSNNQFQQHKETLTWFRISNKGECLFEVYNLNFCIQGQIFDDYLHNLEHFLVRCKHKFWERLDGLVKQGVG